MKKMFPAIFAAVLAFLFLHNRAFSQALNNNEPARPKLVVGIVVDQMRWDYLYRYAARYGAGGFKRLLSEGLHV